MFHVEQAIRWEFTCSCYENLGSQVSKELNQPRLMGAVELCR